MSELLRGKLGDFIQLNYGKSLPKRDRDGEGFPVVGSGGVSGYHSQPLVKGPALVIGRKGSIGEVYYLESGCSPIDTTYYVDDFGEGSIRYWYHLLRSLPLTEMNRATAIPGLNRNDAYDLDVVIAPPGLQEKIAAGIDRKLVRLGDVRERVGVVPPLIEKFRQSVLAAAFRGDLTKEWREQNPDVEPASVLLERIRAERRERYIEDYAEQRRSKAEAKARKAGQPFGDEDDEKALEKARKKAVKRYKGAEPIDPSGLPELPATWRWISHDELLVGITAGKSPKAQGRPAKTREYGVLKQSAVSWGEFDPAENKALFGDIPEGVPTVAKDDLLISRANTVELVGAVVLVPRDFPNLMLSDKTLRLDLVRSVERAYLVPALRGPEVRAYFEDQATGTSDSMRNLSQAKIRAAPIPLAPLSEQRELASLIGELTRLGRVVEDRTRAASQQLQTLTKSILSVAVGAPTTRTRNPPHTTLGEQTSSKDSLEPRHVPNAATHSTDTFYDWLVATFGGTPFSLKEIAETRPDFPLSKVAAELVDDGRLRQIFDATHGVQLVAVENFHAT